MLLAVAFPFFIAVDRVICPLLVLIKQSDSLWYKFRGQGHQLYQISRDDVDYIMETFPIVKRKDIAKTSDEEGEGGEYITKNVILEMYDQMAQLPTMAVPAPKDESATYDVPDVSQWETWLNPRPADESVAHGE